MLPFHLSGRAAAISIRLSALPSTALERWREMRAQFERPAFGFDLLRVYLGIGLVIRGALFAREPALLDQFIHNSSWLFPMLLAHALVLSHVVGGLMLSVGCCTRWAAAVQMPFVAAALFFVHWNEGLLARSQSVEFSALVLFTLSIYLICGAGDFSIDYYMQRVPAEVPTGEPAISFQRVLQQPYATPAADTPRAHSGEDGRTDLRTELAGTELDVAPEPAYAQQEYREVKRELTVLVVGAGTLFVLLGAGFYLAAAAWFIGALVLFGIWSIGHAHFE